MRGAGSKRTPAGKLHRIAVMGESHGSGAFRVVCRGTRGSIPAPGPETTIFGENTSCIEVRGDERLIILDAGTRLRTLGRDLSASGWSVVADVLRHTTIWTTCRPSLGFPFFEPPSS